MILVLLFELIKVAYYLRQCGDVYFSSNYSNAFFRDNYVKLPLKRRFGNCSFTYRKSSMQQPVDNTGLLRNAFYVKVQFRKPPCRKALVTGRNFILNVAHSPVQIAFPVASSSAFIPSRRRLLLQLCLPLTSSRIFFSVTASFFGYTHLTAKSLKAT